MNLPSIKTLQRIPNVDKDTAIKIRSILEDNKKRKLSRIDKLINGYGIEELIGNDDLYWPTKVYYINLGDTYTTTLCKFNGRFIVTSWGYFVEKYPRLFT